MFVHLTFKLRIFINMNFSENIVVSLITNFGKLVFNRTGTDASELKNENIFSNSISIHH